MPRSEENILGSKDIPADAYYGVHMARALDNFTVSGAKIRHFQRFIIALAMVKKASMAATVEFDLLPADKAQAIDQACDEIISGKLHEHFVVDLIQGGAGTSTNLNTNDVYPAGFWIGLLCVTSVRRKLMRKAYDALVKDSVSIV